MSEKTNKQPGIEQKKLQNVDISKLAANPSELSGFIDNTLNQLQTQFEGMANQILKKLEDMGNRIDTLEKSITDLQNVEDLVESEVVANEDVNTSGK